MKLSQYEITAFAKPVSALADEPRMAADELKAWFDSNSVNEAKDAINGIVRVLTGEEGAENVGTLGGGSVQGQLNGILDREIGTRKDVELLYAILPRAERAVTEAREDARAAEMHARRAQELAQNMTQARLVDPVTGQEMGLQDILYSIFYYLGAHGEITCGDWDRENRTCQELDGIDFTCRQFDLENIFALT